MPPHLYGEVSLFGGAAFVLASNGCLKSKGATASTALSETGFVMLSLARVFLDVSSSRFESCTPFAVRLWLMSLVDDDLGCVGFVTLLTVDLATDSLSELKLSNDVCLALHVVVGIDAFPMISDKGVDSDPSTRFS